MALTHSPKIVTDNLVLCLDAANTKSYSGTGTTWNDISYNGNNGTIDGATFKSPLGVAQSFTCILNADYNVSWSQYSCMGGSDRNGTLSGGDPAININLGDTITFDLSTHSGNNSQAGLLWITTTRPSTTAVTNPTATNNGSSATNISWTPNSAGTYYYQNSSHSNMWGYIYVTDTTASTPLMSFDGTNDDVEITDTESGGTGGGLNTYDLLSGSNNYSISLWFQTTSFPANTSWGISPVLFKAGQRAIYILHGDSTAVDKLAFHGNWSTGGWTYTVESNTLSLNTWYNICFTYNASTGFVCYQNGSSVDTGLTNTANRNYNSNSYIGRVSDGDSNTSTRYWQGRMAIFSIYEKTLTSSEVKQNFDAHKERFGL